MNTGIQRSGATPYLAWTTTTPEKAPKTEPKKDIMAIMVAHGIPYAATATVAYPDDFIRKVQKAKSIYGTKFLHVAGAVPAGLEGSFRAGDQALALGSANARLPALRSRARRALYSQRAQGSASPPRERVSQAAGRFSHLSEKDVGAIQELIEKRWQKLLRMVRESS
jgi:pyruvate/2-oxoacid:ferredoxin oxidoreductase beta subunit